MITGGEIQNEWDKLGFSITPPGIAVFARAIYQLGRQHQRESDEKILLEQDVDPSFKRRLAEAIRGNAGELK